MEKNIFEIFTGDDKVMNLKAIYKENADPLDLTSCTEIVITLPKNDGTFVTLKLTTGKVAILSPAVLGKFTATIDSAVSALLQVGAAQNFDVTFTIAGKVFTVRYYESLTVLQAG